MLSVFYSIILLNSAFTFAFIPNASTNSVCMTSHLIKLAVSSLTSSGVYLLF
jgi:hypothetical protein